MCSIAFPEPSCTRACVLRPLWPLSSCNAVPPVATDWDRLSRHFGRKLARTRGAKPLCHVDIPVLSLERAKAFYADVFAWHSTDFIPGKYATFARPEKGKPMRNTVGQGMRGI